MAKAGYCSECGANSWLREDGSCANGHPKGAVSAVYSVPDEPSDTGLSGDSAQRSSWSRIPRWIKVVLAIVFLPFAILYGIYAMWRKNRFTTPARIALTAVGALLAFAMIASANGQNGTAIPSDPTPPAAPTAAVTVSPDPYEAAAVATETADASVRETAPTVAAEPEPVTPELAPEPVTPEPAPEPKPAPKKSAKASPKVSATVYTTKTGSKYHSNGCRYLSRSKIPISLKAAKSSGLEPCSVCNPPS